MASDLQQNSIPFIDLLQKLNENLDSNTQSERTVKESNYNSQQLFQNFLEQHQSIHSGSFSLSDSVDTDFTSKMQSLYSTPLQIDPNISINESFESSQEEQLKIGIIFGNERNGISSLIRDQSDYSFILPMFGFSQSLNLSTSVASTLSYCHYQGLLKRDQLTEFEKTCLRLQWILQDLNCGSTMIKNNDSQEYSSSSFHIVKRFLSNSDFIIFKELFPLYLSPRVLHSNHFQK